MSDEEEEVATKPKRLTKKGKATLGDDSSSEDDDLFGSDNDENEQKSVAATEEKAVDATYSKENLESAMNDLKPFVSPSIDFSTFLESWDDVDKFVSAKAFYLSDPGGLVKLVSNVKEPISLELKCLVIAIARQTCVLAKSKDDRGMAQVLFKSKIKTDKSMHIGNYVSNTWLMQSVEQLKKTETIEDQKNNMHLNILLSGFGFMQNCFVIDNSKKLNVLKEKQSIDWKGTTEAILEVASSKSLTSLESLAKALTTYLSDFKAISNGAMSATGAAKSSRTSSVDSKTLQDATKKKRDERMRKLRQKAHGARSFASTPGAASATSSMPSAVAPPPAPPSAYRGASASAAAAAGYEPSAPSAQYSTSQQDTSSRWNAPTAPPPAPAPAPPVTSAAAPPSSWGGAVKQEQQPLYQDAGSYNAGDQHLQSQPPPVGDSYNQNNYSGGQASYGGGGASAGAQYDDSYRDPASYQQQPQQPLDSRNNYDRPVGPGPPNAPANPQYNDYQPNHGGDSYYPGASGNDNQSGGADGGSGYRGGGAYDRDPQLQQQQQQYDRYDENQYRGGGGGRNNYNNNKRSRQDAFADDGPSAPGGPGGRDRGPTLPAWVSNDDVGGGGGPPPPPQRHEGPLHDNGGMPPRDMSGGVALAGSGRGWVTNEGGPGGHNLPPPSANLPPPSQSRGPPRGPPPPSFEEPPNLGGGRGRGRTLPAWMTRQNEGPGGGP
ncbi:unnamed protein product [Cylindrotheca closterium]|uniref:Uncharacterized protein n=1 Tax=Cylindrotheca closterium TaxID=2856 RepID=A0AAD2G159_9STRA|nr:unnamed protein product [Cylindrotheca closterium]